MRYLKQRRVVGTKKRLLTCLPNPELPLMLFGAITEVQLVAVFLSTDMLRSTGPRWWCDDNILAGEPDRITLNEPR